MVRENGNAFANAYKYIKAQNEAEANKYRSAVAEAAQKHEDTINRIYNIRESREIARRNHNALLEDCRNDALATIIKAIYIEALDPASLTDNALFIAESMVDGWIKEKGGASRIISECKNKTYLLNRICSIAEEVALDNVKEIEADESDGKTLKEQEDADAEKKAQITQMLAQANSLIAKATALQNGDESVLDNAEADEAEAEKTEEEVSTDDTAESDASSDDVVDVSQPVEEEKDDEETATDNSSLGDPDLGEEDSTESENKEEKSEEKADSEEEKAEEEAPEEPAGEEKSEDDSEEEDKKEEDESEEDSDDDEFDDDDDSELTDSDEDEDDYDDLDVGDLDEDEEDDEDIDTEDTEEMEAGEKEDQQEAEEELTGESLDDETVDDEEEIEDTSVDGENTEPQGKIFDELDKEEEVKKAVEKIAQRVADAEEDFIKRNAEDKKKIDDLLGKISDNIKTVEDLSDNDSTQSKIAQESTMMLKRQIKNITNNRPQSVFERMARKLTENVTTDSDLRSIYLAESGRTDIASVIEHTKVMYGFLEALRTLQLENVDAKYIENVLSNM